MPNDLATRNPSMTSLSLGDLFQLGEVLTKTGFLPEAIKTPAQAVAIMLKGQELGVPPMYALSNIGIIHGKPFCQSELMLALIYRDQGDRALDIIETTEKLCRIRYQRRGGEAREMAFTIEDASQAGLVQQNPNFKKYPANMLRARCISNVARAAFPDSIAGMYTPEELGARVVVNEQGQIILDDVGASEDTKDAPVQPSERAQGYLGQVADMLGVDELRGIWKVAKAEEEAGDLTKAERRAINQAITERKAELDAMEAVEPEPVPTA